VTDRQPSRRQTMSNSEVLVSVDNVSKKFCRRLRQALWYGVKDLTSELLVRRDSHNELRKNECVNKV
jgi:lipopolysaccharide transport system ATP-binding protein